MPLFQNRSEAGRILAERLGPYVRDSNVLVLGLPRGGVPVAFQVACVLQAELDVFLVRKLGMPGEEELAIGALASGGVRVLNRELIDHLRVSEDVINRLTEREERELERREELYREGRPAIPVQGRTVVVVDDGLATGASMLAASRALRLQGAKKIIVAVPVAARQTCDQLRQEVDEIVCAETPHPFAAVGIWYEDFSQTTDDEVRELLEQAAAGTPGKSREERSIQIPPIGLTGDLVVPVDARAVVLFAHGSGSSRFSSRNRFVAEALHRNGLATLLLDLLTSDEEKADLRTGHLRFDIQLLAGRLVQATEWLRDNPETSSFRIGYFGASTGGGAALVAAAEMPESVAAVVSRGGRPDLAGEALDNVKAPTLLIVGGHDQQVIDLNKTALEQLRCEKKLEIIPGATHLFEEAGALEQVARLASDWFQRHLLASV